MQSLAMLTTSMLLEASLLSMVVLWIFLSEYGLTTEHHRNRRRRYIHYYCFRPKASSAENPTAQFVMME